MAPPDAPTGGAGHGSFVALKQYDPLAPVPHPDSPKAATFDYHAAMRPDDPVMRQFKTILTEAEIAQLRQNPASYKNAALLLRALQIYFMEDTTPPEERSERRLRNLSLATGYAMGLGQNTTKALLGDNIPADKVREEMPGNALAVGGVFLKAFGELSTFAAESKGFREWLASEEAASALAGKDELNAEAAFAENGAYQVGELNTISRVRVTKSGRLLISLDAVKLTKAQREAAKAIHGKTMSGALLSAWKSTSNAREIKEMEEVKRLWNLGTPQAQQQARELAEASYNLHRDRFWRAVRGQGFDDAFRDAGMRFSAGSESAPFYSLPDGTKARMSLEHTVRKADNPLLAVTGENLQFVLIDENSYTLEQIRLKDPFQK
jgi:hypothetical protein